MQVAKLCQSCYLCMCLFIHMELLKVLKVLINPFSGAADRFCSQTGDFLGLHAIKFFQVLCEITFELDSRISFLSN